VKVADTVSAADQKKIQLDGEVYTRPIDSAASDTIDAFFGNLTYLTGKSEEDILAKFKEIYPEFVGYDSNHDGKLSKDELAKAVQDGVFPPSKPDSKLFRLLAQIDSSLTANLMGFEALNSAYKAGVTGFPDGLAGAVRDRLVQLLNGVYPGKVSASDSNLQGIVFNGTAYDVIDEAYQGSNSWGCLQLA